MQKGAFNERICRYFARQIFEGLHFVNEIGLVHRDLKPENIFLTFKDSVIKIADFGFSAPIAGRTLPINDEQGAGG